MGSFGKPGARLGARPAEQSADETLSQPRSQPQGHLDVLRMELALAQAHMATQAGEVPVGAVLFQGDTLLATGQNRVLRDHDPTAHAEVVAMRLAGQVLGNYRLGGCTLFCTLEPCAMCAGAMTHARLDRLVFGAFDSKAGAAGTVLSVLNHPRSNHHLVVDGGMRQEACGAVLREFFQARRLHDKRLGLEPPPESGQEDLGKA